MSELLTGILGSTSIEKTLDQLRLEQALLYVDQRINNVNEVKEIMNFLDLKERILNRLSELEM